MAPNPSQPGTGRSNTNDDFQQVWHDLISDLKPLWYAILRLLALLDLVDREVVAKQADPNPFRAELTQTKQLLVEQQAENDQLLLQLTQWQSDCRQLRELCADLRTQLREAQQARAHTHSASGGGAPDYYALLGLHPQDLAGRAPPARKGILQTALRLQVKIHHPDVQTDPLRKREAQERMKRINCAYEALVNDLCGAA